MVRDQMTFTAKAEDAYTDQDFDAAEQARVEAAIARSVQNSDILNAVVRIDEKLDGVIDAVKYVVNIAEQVKDQATPTIDAITNSPMFKMIAGKVKK